jgi:hypothetical protein
MTLNPANTTSAAATVSAQPWLLIAEAHSPVKTLDAGVDHPVVLHHSQLAVACRGQLDQPNQQPATVCSEIGVGEARHRVGRQQGKLTREARQSLCELVIQSSEPASLQLDDWKTIG